MAGFRVRSSVSVVCCGYLASANYHFDIKQQMTAGGQVITIINGLHLESGVFNCRPLNPYRKKIVKFIDLRLAA
jgi:hypothetical protein